MRYKLVLETTQPLKEMLNCYDWFYIDAAGDVENEYYPHDISVECQLIEEVEIL